MKYWKYFFFVLLLVFYSCTPVKRFSDEAAAKPHSVDYSIEKSTVPLETTVGIASYYGEKFNRNTTASGEEFDMYDLTAAHKDYPFGTIIRLTNMDNKRSVVLRINDRMPSDNKRLIDISYGAAKEIDMLIAGLANVKVEVLKWGVTNNDH